jgi:wyosine [tRNA(Phe)-imidazoG37] synthetase (radical SAM superfamily)
MSEVSLKKPAKKSSSALARSAKSRVTAPGQRAAASASKPAVRAASKAAAKAAAKPAAKAPVKAAAKPVLKAAPPANVPAPKPAAPAKPRAASKPKGPSKPPRTSAAVSLHHGGSASALMALHEGVVYGPVRSRRLGRSLGINLTPAHLKLCSFNCSYCQYGWSDQSRRASTPALENWPAPAAVAKAVASALKTLAAAHDRIDRLTLAGHGEPTMHPRFKEVVTALRKVRDELAPGVPLTVLSNASTLHRDDVRAALADIDERYMKLDAGDTSTLRSVNGTTLPVAQIIEGLCRVPNIVVQSMFVKDRTGRIDNTGDLTIINWVGALERIKPKAVHIYTIDRAPAFPYLQQVPAARLREIAQRVRLAGLHCDVFGIPEEAAAGEAPAARAAR